jgi:DNA-binding GntR family transcriptional regulator
VAERQAEHEVIVQAIADRDADTARAAASRHMTNTVDLIRAAIAAEQGAARP